MKLRDLKNIKRKAKNVYCFRTMAFLHHHSWPSEQILLEANAVWRDALFDSITTPKNLQHTHIPKTK